MAAVHYHTDQFPPDDRLDWPKLVPFIGPATAAVARCDERPVFRRTDFVATAGIPEPTARRIRNILIENEILTVLIASGDRRPSVLCFWDLLRIGEGWERLDVHP